MSYGIDDSDLKLILDTPKSNEKASEAMLFGSRAKGSFDPGSDVDVVLKGHELERTDIIDLKTSLDDLLLPFRFDLINSNCIPEPDLLGSHKKDRN